MSAVADAVNGAADFAASTARTARFVWTTLSDLLVEADEPIDWVVDDLLIRGGTSMIVAKPKVGKSVLTRNVALAVARGQPFLERSTRKGPVAVLCLEEKRSEVARHLRQMGADGEEIHLAFGSSPDEALEALSHKIEECHPTLVVVDPLQRFAHVPDLNDYAKVCLALEPLVDLARTTGTHILIAHHAGKGDRTGGDVVLGSTALFGAVDTLLIYRERNARRTLSSTQRYGTDLAESVVTLDPDTGLISLGAEVSAQQLADARNRVLEALAADRLSEAEIRDRIGGDNTLTAKALRSLVADGQVLREGEGKKGSPYEYLACSLNPIRQQASENSEKPQVAGASKSPTGRRVKARV